MTQAKTFQPQAEGYLSALLRESGWFMSDDGWRHRKLNNALFPWPGGAAARLQTEADDGRQELVYRMLRGED